MAEHIPLWKQIQTAERLVSQYQAILNGATNPETLCQYRLLYNQAKARVLALYDQEAAHAAAQVEQGDNDGR